MQKESIRLALIGIIAVILVINIPEVALLLREKFTIYQPQVSAVIQASYNDISAAVVPLVGRITGIPRVVINGQAIDVDTNDSMELTHGQSLSIEQIDKILSDAHSPAEGTGRYWVTYGIDADIDAAYGLAIFYQESGLGTNTTWYSAGYNTGNIICAGYTTCHGAFRDYSKDANPWASSIIDVMKLLRSYRDNGITTYDKAIYKWAPPEDNNNTEGYIQQTKKLIRAWRNTNKIITNDGGSVINTVTNGTKVPFGNAQAVSAPILENTDSAFGWNVKAALDANNGALRSFQIENNERWSFNATMGYIPNSELKTIVNPGDGWCDLSCRYVQVFKGLGLRITHGTNVESNDIVFLQHGGIALNNCTVEESPYIWSSGTAGFDGDSQDLIVNNRTGKTIKIAVVDNKDGTATIVGKLE